MKPTATGTTMANTPGKTISLIEAVVEMATHLSYSATPSAASKIFRSAAEALDISESYLIITSNAARSAGMSRN